MSDLAAAAAKTAVHLSQAPLAAGMDTGTVSRDHVAAARVGYLTAFSPDPSAVTVHLQACIYAQAFTEQGAGLVGKTSGQFYPVLPWVIG